MLKLKQVERVYRTEEVETTAIAGVSLTIEQGEFLAIMGPSGCGKSTLLNVIGLLDGPTGGSYDFMGTEIVGKPERALTDIRKSNIGFIFQSFNLVEELNVFENVELALLYQNIPAAERRKKVEAVLEKLNIAHRARHMPQQLSGGQQQRVAVARAVVNSPRLILADEPTGNLDSHNGEEVMQLLTELNKQGTTVVMVTHSDAHAGYARRVVHLFDGQIVAERQQAAA